MLSGSQFFPGPLTALWGRQGRFFVLTLLMKKQAQRGEGICPRGTSEEAA